jgi:hypothetical protein
MRTFARALLALLLSIASANLALGQTIGGPTPSPEGAKVYFVDLKDGATIAPNTTVHFGLHGMGVAPAGSDKANSGHHHLLIDTDLPPLDEPIPSDENHLHFGAGQTEVDLTLAPGPHTLQLLLGDKNHIPHSPPVMSERVRVVVALEAASPTVTPQAKSDALVRHPSAPGARVYIVSPANGARTPLTLEVRFGLDNMEVARAGVDKPNTGHHHLLIDAPLPPFDEPIPNDESHLHFGAGQTEATITLTPGKHTLQLLLGDANHVPHDPPVFSPPLTVFAVDATRRKTCKSGQEINALGACVARSPVVAPQRPIPRREAKQPRRHNAPDRLQGQTERREDLPRALSQTPDAAPTFDDRRPCPPGSHSQSAPVSSGYRCIPN